VLPDQLSFSLDDEKFRQFTAPIDAPWASKPAGPVVPSLSRPMSERSWATTRLEGLRDPQTRRHPVLRLRKAILGLLGDVKPVAQGVYEMREFFGPGWRMY
jgi:hypothetical protein